MGPTAPPPTAPAHDRAREARRAGGYVRVMSDIEDRTASPLKDLSGPDRQIDQLALDPVVDEARQPLAET